MIVSEVGSTSNKLTTLEAVKRELNIATTALNNDKDLWDNIQQASDLIEHLIERKLGRVTVVERLRSSGRYKAVLDRTPLISITSLKRRGSTISSTTYVIENADAGIVFKETSFFDTRIWKHNIEDYPSGTGKLDWEFTYVGGYILPGSTMGARTLPYDIERAAIELVKASYHMEGINPMLKSEKVGEASQTFFDHGGNSENFAGLPPSVTKTINRYSRSHLFS